MRRIGISLCAAVVGVTLYAVTATAAGGSTTACHAGVTKVNGVPARTFCGPAKAIIHVGTKVIRYSGGECSKDSFGFAVNIGTVVLGNAKHKPEYFGLTATPSAGTHDGGVAVNHLGKGLALAHATIVLKSGLKSGTFAGKVFGSPTRISGSFSC